MGFKCGIVGLPNVGKSTIFNALTQAGALAANYPFATVDPNVGRVPVPDPRIDQLSDIVKPDKITPTWLDVVDIAGLVPGASRGEGLGNQFLGHIREVDAILQVVRCFSGDVTHVEGRVDPVADVELIEFELVLADQESADKRLDKAQKTAKSNTPDDLKARNHWQSIRDWLHNQGRPLRFHPDTEVRQVAIREGMLTAKPVLYIANVSEDEAADDANPLVEALRQSPYAQGATVLPVSAAIEAELISMDEEDRQMFLADLGLTNSGLDRIIEAGYNLLHLTTFFTAGVQEVRAWTTQEGSTAPQAAGKIHTDFEKGFIRAEVASYEDFVACHGWNGTKDAGKMRLEGRDYVVLDGDVVYFRFNV